MEKKQDQSTTEEENYIFRRKKIQKIKKKYSEDKIIERLKTEKEKKMKSERKTINMR